MKCFIKLSEMEGSFDSMPRAIFVSERAKKKYFGQDETPDEQKDEKED